MKFISKYQRHRLVMKPTVFKINEWGQREAIEGREIQFDNGKYQTDDKDEIRFLLGHKALNVDYKVFADNGEPVVDTKAVLKEKKTGRGNHNKGRIPWNKGLKKSESKETKAVAV